jgi:hypothetical protein
MKAKRHRQRGVASTTVEAKLSQSLGDLGDGLYGDAAWDYVNRYIQLKAQSFELEKKRIEGQNLVAGLSRSTTTHHREVTRSRDQ